MTVIRPPFDPELFADLQKQPRRDGPIDLATQRAALDKQTPTIDELIAGTGFEHAEHTVPGPQGAPDVTLAVIRDPAVTRPGPIFYHTHGGGMMLGNRAVGGASFPVLVKEFGATVVSVEYRLAPEHPFPAGVEDSYAGLLWTAEHAEEIGGDAGRLVVFGESAGGGITAAIALMARDRHGPAILGQILSSPMLDDRVDTASAHQFWQTPAPWSGEQDVQGWTALLGEARGTDGVSPYAAPARASDLSGLPSALIEAGSAEVFRDEDVDYATRIWAAGGQAELHVWAGAYHGYQMMPDAAITGESMTARVDWARRLLGAS